MAALGVRVPVGCPGGRVQFVVAEKLENGAVKLVGAGFYGDVDDASLEVAELGGGVAGDHLELLDRIHAGLIGDHVGILVVVVHPVQQKVVSLLAVPVDIGPAARGGAQAVGEAGGIDCGGAGGKQSELHEVASVERQVRIGGRSENVAHLRAFRLQLHSNSGDLHRLGYRADIHGQIEADPGVDFQIDAAAHRGVEAGSRERDFEIPGRQTRKRIDTFGVGFRIPRSAMIDVFRGDLGVHYSGAGRIGNGTGDTGTHFLGVRAGSQDKKDDGRIDRNPPDRS